MGKLWSKYLASGLFIKQKAATRRIGLLGLDNAGKTTTLYQLKHKKYKATIPTVGFNVETVQCGKLLLNIWDICGGKPKTRALWQQYNKNTAGMIFVLDAADLLRLRQAARELHWLLSCKELSKVPFLIYANKQDQQNVLSAEQLLQFLGLMHIKQQWAIQECCALNGRGLWEGLQQLQQMLLNKKHK